jgi:hypothetical protein
MMQPTTKPQTANWEITAISFRCDYIHDFVTVRVHRDWLAMCTWYLKYKSNVSKGSKQALDPIVRQRINECVGPDCPLVAAYRDKLIKEEAGKK